MFGVEILIALTFIAGFIYAFNKITSNENFSVTEARFLNKEFEVLEYDRVVSKIKSFSSMGHTTYTHRSLSENTINKLKSKGFKVDKVYDYYLISW